jgi:drug/metabolite transporter (DMT)-like permease
MVSILIAVITITWIFTLFKLFPKYQVNTFQAVVFNYLAACISGILIYGNQITHQIIEHPSWIKWAILSGGLFISLFFLMGKSSQNNGVATTTIVVKMSMALSLLLMIFIYHEAIFPTKVFAIILALLGVVFLSINKDKEVKQQGSKLILLVIFIGCGGLDFILNYIQNYELNHISSSLFSAFGLGIAGVLGLIILLFKSIFRSEKIQLKNIIGGILLGVPNYFSIYYLIHAYETLDLPDTTVLAIINILSVLASITVGYFVFKEKLEKIKIFGIILCFLSIYLFTLS